MKSLTGKMLLGFLIPFCMLMSIGTIASAQCTPGPGDLVFTGYNAIDDGNGTAGVDDSFSFLLLKGATAGQVIYFTDLGWTDANAFQPSNRARTDAVIKWTADVNYPAGTELIFYCKYNLVVKDIGGTIRGTAAVQQLSYNQVNSPGAFTVNMNLADLAPDQIFAFTGSVAAPTFLAGISINGNPGTPWAASLSAAALDASSSRLPASLSTGSQNLGIAYLDPDDAGSHIALSARYNKIAAAATTGSPAALLALINNPANWLVRTDGSALDPLQTNESYTINGITIATQPVDRLNLCPGSGTTFSITATNACSYQWQLSTDNGANFNNITEGGVYTGTATAALTISNVAGLGGNKYRVLLSGAGATSSAVVSLSLLNPVLVFNITTVAAGFINTAYSQPVNITSGGSGSYTYSLISGLLPPGLTIAPGSGLISGIPTQSGTYNFTLRATDGCTTPNTADQSYALVISKADQTVAFSLAAKTYGDIAFTLPATSSAGSAVAYTSSNTAVASISGNTLTITGAGTADITATAAASANYNASLPVTQTLTVSKKAITLTLNAAPLITKTYDYTTASTLVPANYTLNGLVNSDVITVTGTAEYTTKDVGNNKTINLSNFLLAGTQKDNYLLGTVTAATTGNITALPVTVALNASPLISKTYDNTTAAALSAANYSITGVLGADEVSVSGTATYDTKDAGTGKIVTASALVLAGAQKDNYNLSVTSAATTGNVTALPLSLAMNATPMISKTYDHSTLATLVPANYGLTGVLGADDVSISGTANYDTDAAGTGKTITVTGIALAGAQKDNYQLATSTSTTTGNITAKALTLALSASPLLTKPYDNSTSATLLPANYLLSGVIGADAVNVTGTANYDTKDAGTGKTVTANTFVLAGAQKDNYTLLTSTATTTGNITAIPLTLALNATPLITKAYNGNNTATLAAANYSLTGVLGADAVAASGTASYNDAEAGNGKIVTLNGITLNGAQKDNYILYTTTASTTGNITSIPLTLALNAAPLITKEYDHNNTATLAPANYTLTGLLPTDIVTVSGTATYTNEEAGTGKTITATSFVLAGAQKDNYNLITSSVSTTGNITAKAITLALNALPLISKPYDNTTLASLQAANYSLTGLIGGDDVSVSGTATYDSKDAGTAKTITANSFVLAGARKDNYSLSTSTASTTGNITALPLTLALNAAPLITKVYDATTPITLSAANYNLSGVLGADVVTVTGTAAFDTKDAGTGKTVTANTFVLAGAQKDNYSLSTSIASTTGSITAKPVSLTLNESPLITKAYDNSTSATLLPANYQLAGVLGTDELTVSGSASYDTKDRGTGKTISLNNFVLAGAQKDNYSLVTTSASTRGNITAIPLTLALNASPLVTKVYDNNTNANLVPANYTLSGILGSDAVTVNGTAMYDNKNAGRGKTITVGSFVLAGAQKDNYTLNTQSAATQGNITQLPVTLTLNASPSITKEYDGNNTATLQTGNYSLNTILGNDELSVSGNAVFSDKNAGTSKLITANNFVLAGAQKDNYLLSTNTASTSGTISKKALTVTADDQTKFQGLANPALTFRYSGFINGEDAGVLTTLPTASSTATTGSSIGNYPITLSGGAAANYSFVYVQGTLAVVPGAPTGLTFAAVPVYENQPAGTAAGSFSSTSLNPSSTFSYALVAGAGDTDNDAFSINGNQLIAARVFDYEAKSSYSIRVRTTTQFGQSLDQQFSVNITDVNEIPTLDAIANQTICYTSTTQNITLTGISAGEDKGQSTSLSVSSSNTTLFQNLAVSAAGQLSYRLRNGATGSAIVTVTVKDNGGTANAGIDSYSRTFNIQVNALPVISITADKGRATGAVEAEISRGETVRLTASGGLSYVWSANSSIISGANTAVLTVRPANTSTYTVTATNASGCSETQTFSLNVLDDLSKINATNILSPNGDGYNDKWIVENIDLYPNNTVKIFDKAGRVLYTKKGYDNSWDGMVGGNPLAEGTYYYIIDFGANRRVFKGFITIVREN